MSKNDEGEIKNKKEKKEGTMGASLHFLENGKLPPAERMFLSWNYLSSFFSSLLVVTRKDLQHLCLVDINHKGEILFVNIFNKLRTMLLDKPPEELIKHINDFFEKRNASLVTDYFLEVSFVGNIFHLNFLDKQPDCPVFNSRTIYISGFKNGKEIDHFISQIERKDSGLKIAM